MPCARRTSSVSPLSLAVGRGTTATHKIVSEVGPRVPKGPHARPDEDGPPRKDGRGDELELGVVQEGERRLLREGVLVAVLCAAEGGRQRRANGSAQLRA